MKQYRHRRTANPSHVFPTLEPGELSVNTANRQLAVGDANVVGVGTPLPLLAIRYFDARGSYAAGDMVVQAGKLYTANAAVPPGAFNSSQWTEFTGGGGTATDPTKVLKAGDVMTGHLSLPTNPAAANAVRKDYVDTADAALTTAINNKSSLTVSDTPPSSPVDGALWWESDTGMLYVRYNDGVGPAQWVQAAAVPSLDPTAFVAKTGDIMTGHLSLPTTPAAANAVRKDYVDSAIAAYAAPFDAMAYNGMQINGSMDVNQQGVGSAPTGQYCCDGWAMYSAGLTGTLGIQDNGAPTLGFTNRIYTKIGTAKPSLAAADYLFMSQRIEGYRVARLGWGSVGAQPITIAFWSQHTLPGTYTIAVRNNTSDRSYVTTYTQNVADALEYKVVTIPGPTSGTGFGVTNNVGFEISFTAACGSTFIAPSTNAWVTGNYLGATGQVNSAAATTNFMVLRGVVFFAGIYAPTAAQSPLIMRPYDQELLTCKRYWQWMPPCAGQFYANTSVQLFSAFSEMRAAPAFGFSGAAVLTNPSYGNYTITGLIANNLTTIGGTVNVTTSAGTATYPVFLQNAKGVTLDARL